MKTKISVLLLLALSISLMLTGCDLIGIVPEGDNTQKFDDELDTSTGKWILSDDEDTYFTFDGSKDVMTFSYTEDGALKYDGKYRVVAKANGTDVLTPLTFILTRSDKEKEDWLSCYVDDFDKDFTQFTVMDEEEDLGMIDASIYTYLYRISELPYKMGTYILEGEKIKEEKDIYSAAEYYTIPCGTYVTEGGASFEVFYTKPLSYTRFRYINGEITVEGVFTVAADKSAIYLYIENDPYNKVTNADKEHYDTTFGIYYPPDFNLYGNFDVTDNSFTIDRLFRHTETRTEVQDSAWVFGAYTKAD